jgi:riboflavin synthase
MFTGLIEYTGSVEHLEKNDTGASIRVKIASLSGAVQGDSVAVNGACLTLTSMANGMYTFDISSETMQKAGFGQGKTGDIVNVEMPRRVSDMLHGHIVNGHIDCTAVIAGIRTTGKYHIVTFELSAKTPYLVEKGFIAVDGISVTPYDVKERMFTISVIPYTYEHTNLKVKKTGDTVNIEFDIIAKYIESMLNKNKGNTVTEAFLKERGFA